MPFPPNPAFPSWSPVGQGLPDPAAPDPFGSVRPLRPQDPLAFPLSQRQMGDVTQSLVDTNFLDTGKNALHWLGDALSKWGRPVRAGLGALSGMDVDPHEFLAFLPFSDTLGLTNPKNAVTGKDLNRHWGLTSSEDPDFFSWENAGNFLTDTLTDPLTLATFGAGGAAQGGKLAAEVAAGAPRVGALTRAFRATPEWVPFLGKRAAQSAEGAALAGLEQTGKKALVQTVGATEGLAKTPLTDAGKLLAEKGLLPANRGMQLKGFRSLQELPEEQLKGFRSLQELPEELLNLRGAGPHLPGHQSLLDEIVEGARTGQGTPLSGVARFNVPFTRGRVGLTVGTNPLTRTLAGAYFFPFGTGALGSAGRALADALLPAGWEAKGKQLFSKSLGGNQPTALGQQMYKNTLAPLQRQLSQESGEVVPGLLQDLAGSGGKALTTNDPDMVRYLNDVLEGVKPQSVPPSLPPAAQQAAGGAYNQTRQLLDSQLARLQELGYDVQPLAKRPDNLQYFPRQADAPLAGFPRAAASGSPAPSGGGAGAAGLYRRQLDASRNVVNDLLRDPVLSGLARTAPDDAAAVQHFLANYTQQARPGGFLDPTQAEGIVQWLRSAPKANVDEAMGLFNKNPLADLQNHLAAASRKAAAAQTAHRELAARAIPEAELLAKGVNPAAGTVSLPQALGELGLAQGQDHLADTLGGLLGRTVKPEELQGWRVTADTLGALRNLVAPAAGGESLLAKVPGLDTFTNLWKTFQTLPFPAHHFQNALTGLWQNVVAGTASPANYKRMLDLLSGKTVKGLARTAAYRSFGTDEAATRAAVRQLAGAGVLETSGAHQAALTGAAAAKGVADPLAYPGVASLGEQFLGAKPLLQEGAFNPLAVRGAFGKTETAFAPARLAEGGAEFYDRLNRGADYFGRVFQGAGHEGAAAGTLTNHLDFRGLTDFERGVMRRLLPFYSWQRLIVPQQLGQLARSPGRIGALVKGEENAQDAARREGYVPEARRDGFVFPIHSAIDMKHPLSGRPERNSVLGDVTGMPLEDLVRASGAAAGRFGVADFLGDVLGGIHPLAKLGTEIATGRDFSTGDPWKLATDARWSEDPQYKALRQAAEYLPGGRFVSTGRRVYKGLTDPDSILSPTEVLLSELGPARVKQVEANTAFQRDLQENLERMIGGTWLNHGLVPGVKEKGGDYYVPLEEQHKVYGTPAEALMRTLATTKKEADITSLYKKIEKAEEARDELARLQGLDRPLSAEEAARLRDIRNAVDLLPLWRQQVAQEELRRDYQTGLPQVKAKAPTVPGGAMKKPLQIGVRMSRQ